MKCSHSMLTRGAVVEAAKESECFLQVTFKIGELGQHVTAKRFLGMCLILVNP